MRVAYLVFLQVSALVVVSLWRRGVFTNESVNALVFVGFAVGLCGSFLSVFCVLVAVAKNDAVVLCKFVLAFVDVVVGAPGNGHLRSFGGWLCSAGVGVFASAAK